MESESQKLSMLEKNANARKLKALEKQLLVEKFEEENQLIFNENEEVLIECNIGSLSNIYSRYDMQKTKTLEPLLFSYILEETDIVPLYHNLQLTLYVYTNTTDEEEEQARKAIKTHFSFNVARDNFVLKRKTQRAKISLLFGLMCLFGSALVSTLNTSVFPIYELLLIFTWFFSWEGSGILFVEQTKIKNHRLNMLRLYNAEVVFVRSKNPPKSVIMGNPIARKKADKS